MALSAGDRLQLPVAIVNDTAQAASIKTYVTATGLAALRACEPEIRGRRVGVIISGGNTDFGWLDRAPT